jgi:hypothetical protein
MILRKYGIILLLFLQRNLGSMLDGMGIIVVEGRIPLME